MTPVRVVVLIVVVAIAGATAWYFWPQPAPPPLTINEPRVVAAPGPQGPLNPVPEAAQPQPLPTVKESDPLMKETAASLIGADTFARYLQPDEIVHRIVATIDNLPRASYAARLNPVKTPAGMVATTGQGDSLVLSPGNAERYAPYVRVFAALDSDKLVAAYTGLYPLFQKAYVDLGYPNGYFNDRLVEVIDHLLEAPEPKGPVKLAVPHVLYEYADPDLQALSGGQKLLVRMGPANEEKVKAKLREIRERIARAKP
jgi:hypothetical protein